MEKILQGDPYAYSYAMVEDVPWNNFMLHLLRMTSVANQITTQSWLKLRKVGLGQSPQKYTPCRGRKRLIL